MSTIDRRHFLALLMGSAAAACGDDAGSAPTSDAGFYDDADCPPSADAGGADAGAPDAPTATIAERIDAARSTARAYFRDADDAALADIGVRYLDATAPGRSDEELSALFERVLMWIEPAPDQDCALADLQDAVRADFEARVIADLEGWTLSETELSLAALVAA